MLFLILLSKALLLDATSVKLRLDQPFFEFLAPFGRKLVESQVPDISIPEVHKKFKGIHMTVHNYRNFKYDLPQFAFALGPDGLTWTTSGGHFGIEADWTAEKRIIAGRVTADVHGINLLIKAKIVNENGHPQLRLEQCQTHISDLNIGIHGHLFAAIARLFRDQIEDSFKKAIEHSACRLVTDAISTKINPQLASLPTEIPIKHGISIRYEVDGQPVFTPEFLEAGLVASVVYGDDVCTPNVQLEFHGSPTAFMASLINDENIANCMVSALHKADRIKFKADSSTPELAPFLRTNCDLLCIGKFAPLLGEKYPNRNVQFFFHSTEGPRTHFSPGKLRIDASLTVTMNLTFVEGAENPESLAVFLLNATFAGDGYFEGNFLKAHLLQSDAALQVVSSEIGPIDPSHVNDFVGKALSAILTPVLASGYEIPSYKGVKIADTSKLVGNDGYGEVNINLILA